MTESHRSQYFRTWASTAKAIDQEAGCCTDYWDGMPEQSGRANREFARSPNLFDYHVLLGLFGATRITGTPSIWILQSRPGIERGRKE